VASGAGNVVFSVLRTPDVSSIKLIRMAIQANGDDLLRLHLAECMDDGIDVTARVHMCFTGTVA
jgi:hypothetical protein